MRYTSFCILLQPARCARHGQRCIARRVPEDAEDKPETARPLLSHSATSPSTWPQASCSRGGTCARAGRSATRAPIPGSVRTPRRARRCRREGPRFTAGPRIGRARCRVQTSRASACRRFGPTDRGFPGLDDGRIQAVGRMGRTGDGDVAESRSAAPGPPEVHRLRSPWQYPSRSALVDAEPSPPVSDLFAEAKIYEATVYKRADC